MKIILLILATALISCMLGYGIMYCDSDWKAVSLLIFGIFSAIGLFFYIMDDIMSPR